MRIYLDTCCLMRPFDDQTQVRIQIETRAVESIIKSHINGDWEWIAGRRLHTEISACPWPGQRAEVLTWLDMVDEWYSASIGILSRRDRLIEKGLGKFDAEHLATAEAAAGDLFLTVDRRLLSRGRSLHPPSMVRLLNPVEWILEKQS